MLAEIHDFLGLCAPAVVVGAIAAGLAAHRYQFAKQFLKWKRPTLVTAHGWGAIAFAVLVILHYVTTDKTLLLLYVGVAAFAAVLLLGLSFRLSRAHVQTIVKVKIALVVVAAAALTLGHDQLEDKYPELREGDLGSRSERVTPPAPADRCAMLSGVLGPAAKFSSGGTRQRHRG